MRRRTLRWVVVGVAAMAMSTALAAHRQDWDVRIGLDGWVARSVARVLPIRELGDTLFDAQEGVHRAVKRTTGVEIDHHYIRIGIGGEELPVDPFEFHR